MLDAFADILLELFHDVAEYLIRKIHLNLSGQWCRLFMFRRFESITVLLDTLHLVFNIFGAVVTAAEGHAVDFGLLGNVINADQCFCKIEAEVRTVIRADFNLRQVFKS